MTTETPIVHTPEQQERIRKAIARLEAARLRVKACQQERYAAGHLRQAEHPIYAGQESVCAQKGGEAQAMAAETRAQADLLEAEAGV